MSRCLFNSNFKEFIGESSDAIFGAFSQNYHGEALTKAIPIKPQMDSGRIARACLNSMMAHTCT